MGTCATIIYSTRLRESHRFCQSCFRSSQIRTDSTATKSFLKVLVRGGEEGAL